MPTCVFTNNTSLPVQVKPWEIFMFILSETQQFVVLPGETVSILSEVGHWIIHTYLKPDLCQPWNRIGITPGFTIGRFSNRCDYSGNFLWCDRDDFVISKTHGMLTFDLSHK
jgi:hypothetical protein